MKTLICIVCLLFAASTAQAQIKSVYTDLSDSKCKTLESTDDEGGSYRGECPGTAGYKLELLEGDLRQSVNIIEPSKRKRELRFWELFGGFSSVGPKAEWRVKNKKPIAVIIRLNVSEDPENSAKTTSYLIVAKITETEACVTDTLKPTRSQNAEARRAADRSADRPCRRISIESSDSAFIPSSITPDLGL